MRTELQFQDILLSCKTYHIKKQLNNNTDRDLFIVTRSPERHENFNTTIDGLKSEEYRCGLLVMMLCLISIKKQLIHFLQEEEIRV